MASLSSKEIESRLNSIARLRLIFNTTEELNKYVGFNSGASNSLSRIGGDNAFIKNAVYDSLCRYVKEESGLELNSFIEEYQIASEYFERKRLSWLSRRNNAPCYELLKYVYRDLSKDKMQDKVLASIVDEIYDAENGKIKINVLLLILMALKLLPLYTKGRGDVNDIMADFEQLFVFLSPLMTDNKIFQINQAYEIWKEDIHETPSIATRYNLYNALNEIIDNYVTCTDNRALYLSNLDIQSNIDFPMGDMLWEEDSLTYWKFEALDNGYFATQYKIDSITNRIGWTRYEIIIYSNEGDYYAYIIDPKGSLKLMRGNKIADNDVDICNVKLDILDGHRKASFEPISDKNWFRIDSMIETNLTFEDFCAKYRGYKFVDKNPQATYHIISQITAVSREYIFIPNEDGRFFRIPKSISHVLEYVSVNDNAGLYELQLSKEKIIGFVDQGIYINVSNQVEYEEKGIRLLPTITFPQEGLNK